jgi:hypothetical protein
LAADQEAKLAEVKKVVVVRRQALVRQDQLYRRR